MIGRETATTAKRPRVAEAAPPVAGRLHGRIAGVALALALALALVQALELVLALAQAMPPRRLRHEQRRQREALLQQTPPATEREWRL